MDETTTASTFNWRAFMRPWLESGDRMNPLLVVPLLEAMDTEIGQLQAAARAVVERWEVLTYELPGTIDDPIVGLMDALQATVEAADQQ